MFCLHMCKYTQFAIAKESKSCFVLFPNIIYWHIDILYLFIDLSILNILRNLFYLLRFYSRSIYFFKMYNERFPGTLSHATKKILKALRQCKGSSVAAHLQKSKNTVCIHHSPPIYAHFPILCLLRQNIKKR